MDVQIWQPPKYSRRSLTAFAETIPGDPDRVSATQPWQYQVDGQKLQDFIRIYGFG